MVKYKIKVSIIVPVYNVEKFVNKCVESIIQQTYKNLEIILVDDGSRDNSGVLCDTWADRDQRIKVIHKINGGVSAARNSGIDDATGDYVCFVDGDDFVMPDYVEYMLNLAVRNDAEIALTTEMFGNFEERQIDQDCVRIWSGEEATAFILCYRIPIGCYCKIFKRNFLGEEIRFYPDMFIGEGFNFNAIAFQRAQRVIAGKRRIYYYRRDNPTSAMTQFSIRKCENGLLAVEIIKNNFTIKSDKIDKAWRYANWRTHTDFYDMMVLANAVKMYPEMYKKCVFVTKRDALSAFAVPTSSKDRLRALTMKICPSLVPLAMKARKLKYHGDTSK